MLSSKSPYFLKNFEYNGMRKLTSSIVPTAIVSEQKPKTIMKKKDQIPKKVKEEVWNKYIGDDIPKHLCLCCKLNRIKILDFQVGHVISEKDGGTLAISNLRPICASCNHSMGSENMLEYAKKYEFIIG
jgi:5-methylcytosine-specific restriction endonuclease McrA